MKAAGKILAVFGLAALIGGMLFFAAVMAPLVFTKLPMNVAGPFIKTAFPFYYLYMTATAAIGTLGFLLLRRRVSALLLGAVLLVTIWLWAWLLPHLNTLQAAGDLAGFQRGHTLSVWIDGAQFIIAAALLLQRTLSSDK